MEEIVLQDWVLKRIKDDLILTAKISEHLEFKSLRYFMEILKQNDPRLTQAGVLMLLKEHLQVEDEKTLLTLPEPEKATA